jgi:hypothetical protein
MYPVGYPLYNESIKSRTWAFFHTNGRCISGIAISLAAIKPKRALIDIDVFVNFSPSILYVDYFLLIIKTLFIGTTPLLMPANLKKISLNTITLNMFEPPHFI